MTYASKNNAPPKTRDLPMPVEAKQLYDVSEQSWKVLTEVTFPSAKTPEAILMALDYCRTVLLRPVHLDRLTRNWHPHNF